MVFGREGGTASSRGVNLRLIVRFMGPVVVPNQLSQGCINGGHPSSPRCISLRYLGTSAICWTLTRGLKGGARVRRSCLYVHASILVTATRSTGNACFLFLSSFFFLRDDYSIHFKCVPFFPFFFWIAPM